MKLRLDTNSVRLRVRKSDLEKLRTTGNIINAVAFIDNILQYELCIDKNIQQVESVFKDHIIRVSLPEQMAKQWIHSDQVGIEATMQIGADASLYILVEKDFPCKDRLEEDKQDTFEELADKLQVPKC